ncbi:MAG: acyl-CoA dehydrogenase family protein [Actinomycetota bacterium]
MSVEETIVERARRIADEVLFPSALRTDAADLLPVANLDRLAHEGFYGMVGPAEACGLELDPATSHRVVETLATGCLTTTFVWLQSQNPLRAAAASRTPGLCDAWVGPLCRGERRAGIALAGNRPGPAILHAAPSPGGGFVLDGEAPWVSGWGRIDVMLVTARDGDTVVSALVDAVEAPTLHAERLRLVGANASGTVTLRFSNHAVPPERIIGREPHADVLARDPIGLRMNGSLALGVIARCCMLMGPSSFDDELVAVRSALDGATPDELPAARAGASELAIRAAAALTVAQGSRSILLDQHAQRLAREGLFLLVFGSRPAIRDELQRRLARSLG